jgi:hypothetical protein
LIPESTINKSGCSGVNHLSGRGNFPGNNFLLPKIFMKFFFHAQFFYEKKLSQPKNFPAQKISARKNSKKNFFQTQKNPA